MEGFRLSRGAHNVRVFAGSLAAKASRGSDLVGTEDVMDDGGGIRVSDPEGKVDGESVRVFGQRVNVGGDVISSTITAYCVECNDVLTSDDDRICSFFEDYVSFESDPNWNKVLSEEDKEDEYSSSLDMEVTSSRRLDCDPKSNSVGDRCPKG
ncbi:hypothetical protein RND81_12G022400 [Saponaria officinalis]|uniref:Uncharacterized protein n=1 Tax=Saponaria officinalis TaxID=3572 RepID=A0AAW1H2A9_SAPOF